MVQVGMNKVLGRKKKLDAMSLAQLIYIGGESLAGNMRSRLQGTASQPVEKLWSTSSVAQRLLTKRHLSLLPSSLPSTVTTFFEQFQQ
jgi:hypothetical protein